MKPAVSVKGFEFYVIDFNTLMLSILIDRFPRSLSLNNGEDMLIKLVPRIIRHLSNDVQELVRQNTNVLFIGSKNPLQTKFLLLDKYTNVGEPRMDSEILSVKQIKENKKEQSPSQLIDNKVPFDYARFLSTSKGDFLTSNHIKTDLNLK